MEVELPTEYDVIVVGTGLVECIIAAASARIGKKVLHIDRNDYYGGQWASFTLQGIEQWLMDITAVKDKADVDTKESYDLAEGETMLATCYPGAAYSNLKQQWFVNQSNQMEVTVTEVPSPTVPCTSEEANMGEPEITKGGSHEERQPEEQEISKEKLIEEEKMNEPEITQGKSAEEEKTENNKTEISSENSDVPPSFETSERPPWSQENMMKLSRKFNLDLAPKLLFSRGSLVELLISSNVARYAEFKCITRILTWLASGEEEGRLVVVPCSRSDVFTTDSVSLVEKRLLMKLLEFCHNYEQHSEQWEEYTDKTFIEFLKSRRQTPNLIHFVTEAIAMVDKNVSCHEGLERTKLFLTSLGRYGTTPFLFSMYGCGELPQAFCRLCAVFEGTYVLRRPIAAIVLNESNSCVGLLSEGERFKCSHLVMDAFYAPSQYLPICKDAPEKSISRGIFIVDRSIMANEKEQLTLLRLPVKGGNTKPVTVLEVGVGAGVCPKDLYCVQMTCQGCDAEQDLKVAVDRLFASEENTDKPKLLWSLYFNQVDVSDADLKSGVPENIHLCSGPDSNMDYDSAITQARTVFTRMFPEEEFLPRAPDPEEIVFDNAGAEPKQGDNFSSGDSSEKKEENEMQESVEGESEGNSNDSPDEVLKEVDVVEGDSKILEDSDNINAFSESL